MLEERPSVLAYCIIQSIFLILSFIFGFCKIIVLLLVKGLSYVFPLPLLPPGVLDFTWLGNLFLSAFGLLVYLIVEGLIGGVSDLTWKIFVMLINVLPRVDISTDTTRIILGDLLNLDWDKLFPDYSIDTGLGFVSKDWDGYIHIDLSWVRDWLVVHIDQLILVDRSWYTNGLVWFQDSVIDLTSPPSAIFFNDILGIQSPFTQGVYNLFPEPDTTPLDPNPSPKPPVRNQTLWNLFGFTTQDSFDRWVTTLPRDEPKFSKN